MAAPTGQPASARDDFAAAAMQAIMIARGPELLYLAAGDQWAQQCAKLAEASYVMADAMVAASG